MERGGSKGEEESGGVGRGRKGRGARGVMVSVWQKCQHQTGIHTHTGHTVATHPTSYNTLW